MTKRVVVGVATGTLLAAAALAQGADQSGNETSRAIRQSRAIYVAHCTSCHGVDARGGVTGTNHVAAPDLTLIAVRDGSFDLRHVANHIDRRKAVSESEMPCWGEYFKTEVEWPAPVDAGAYPFRRRSEQNATTRVYLLAHYLDFIQAAESAPPVKP